MNLALLGYGKMGKAIEQVALKRGHRISQIIEKHNYEEIYNLKSKGIDVAIEFTTPEAAFENIKNCLLQKIPCVSGTTGWLSKKEDIEKIALENDTAFFYASNFSVGVNVFFRLNQLLAKIMKNFPEYYLEIEEVHHTQKKDAPSGTAITLAEDLIKIFEGAKKKWVNHKTDKKDEIGIVSKRIENVPGTHIVTYTSNIDTIQIKHDAFSREGFATGAVLAAEFIFNKKGIFGMNDILSL